MSPEVWTMIGTGIVILIAIAGSARHLRSEIHAMRAEHRADIRELRECMTQLETGLRECMTQLETELRGPYGATRNRAARAHDAARNRAA